MQVPQPQKRQVLNVNCVNLLITLYFILRVVIVLSKNQSTLVPACLGSIIEYLVDSFSQGLLILFMMPLSSHCCNI